MITIDLPETSVQNIPLTARTERGHLKPGAVDCWAGSQQSATMTFTEADADTDTDLKLFYARRSQRNSGFLISGSHVLLRTRPVFKEASLGIDFTYAMVQVHQIAGQWIPIN